MPFTEIATEFEDLGCWSPNYSIHDEPGETGFDEGDEGHEGVEMKKNPFLIYLAPSFPIDE